MLHQKTIILILAMGCLGYSRLLIADCGAGCPPSQTCEADTCVPVPSEASSTPAKETNKMVDGNAATDNGDTNSDAAVNETEKNDTPQFQNRLSLTPMPVAADAASTTTSENEQGSDAASQESVAPTGSTTSVAPAVVPTTTPDADSKNSVGEVTEPPLSQTEAVEATPIVAGEGPKYFQRVFGEVSGILQFGSVGRMFLFADAGSDSVAMTSGPLGGIRLAIFKAGGRQHHGVFFKSRWGNMEVDGIGDRVRMMAFGYAFKSVRATNGKRVCPGFAADLGLLLTKNKDMEDSDIDFNRDTFVGIEIHPRFELNIIALNAGGFKLVVPISIGLNLVPFSLMRLMDEPVVISMFTLLQPTMTVGISFGG